MKKVVILSGAGLSAESGISTFRDNGGMWENYDVMDVCSVEGFRRDPQLVLDFYDKRRSDIADKKPNKAHYIIKELKDKFPDDIDIITQNVDDLLEKSGCKDPIHLHGYLPEIYCLLCGETIDIGYDSIKDQSSCPKCGSNKMRHNVVMFGEPAPAYEHLYSAIEGCTLLVVVGTSGYVLPVDQFARYARYSILNNLERSDAIVDRNFTKCYYQSAVDAAEKIKDDVERFLTKGYI